MRSVLVSILLLVATACAGPTTGDGAVEQGAAQPSEVSAGPSDRLVTPAAAVAVLAAAGWWDFAGAYTGVSFDAPVIREAVARDVLTLCGDVAARPSDLDAILAATDRVAAARASDLDAPDARILALVLSTATEWVCPEQADVLASLRQPATPAATVEPPDFAALVVPDPVPGDLRAGAAGDLLPADYVPAPAAAVITDVAYGPDPAQRLDLHLPEAGRAPIIVFLHSGGWVAGDRAAVPTMVLRFLERGYAIASVGYRLAPDHPFPDPIHDVKRAIRWLKHRSATEGDIDGDRIVVFGTSAGGHLAAFTAATPGDVEPTDLPPDLAAVDSTVAGVVAVVGPTDLVAFHDQPHPWASAFTEAHVGCGPCTEAQLRAASPLDRVGGLLPPAYWAYGSEDDVLVDPRSQGAPIAHAWAGQTGTIGSWWDLVEGQSHNLDHTNVNQRYLERFVDAAIASTR